MNASKSQFTFQNYTLLLVCFLVMFLFFSCNKKDVFVLEQPRQQENYRAAVPLYITYTDTDVTPSVRILLNHIPVDVVFDTGSNGLRIFPGAVSGATFETDSSDWVPYGYSSGKSAFYLRGKAAGGSFSIGGLQSTALIKFMLIDSTKYYGKTWQPTGNAKTISAHFRGLSAILGVGLRATGLDDGVANPLAQLPGNGRYLVSFPKYGDPVGSVIINPTDRELNGFVQFHVNKYGVLLPNGYNSWNDKNVKGTFTINGNSLQEPTQVDSGTSDILLYTSQDTVERIYDNGINVSLQLNDTTASHGKITFPITTGRVVGQNRVFIEPAGNIKSYIFGDPLFFAYDIYFDQVNGVIGLRKKG